MESEDRGAAASFSSRDRQQPPTAKISRQRAQSKAQQARGAMSVDAPEYRGLASLPAKISAAGGSAPAS